MLRRRRGLALIEVVAVLAVAALAALFVLRLGEVARDSELRALTRARLAAAAATLEDHRQRAGALPAADGPWPESVLGPAPRDGWDRPLRYHHRPEWGSAACLLFSAGANGADGAAFAPAALAASGGRPVDGWRADRAAADNLLADESG